MKILHILNDGPTKLSDEVICIQAKEHEVKVVDLRASDLSYSSLVDNIVSYDRVMSW